MGNHFRLGLTVKLASGIIMGLIYKYYYANPQADTFTYFESTLKLIDLFENQKDVFFQVFLYDNLSQAGFFADKRSLLFIKILFPLVLVCNQNYWLSGIYLSFFSFYGMWRLANVFTLKFPKQKQGAILAFLYFPSVVFWSSGILKEGLVMALLCLSLSFLFENHFFRRSFTSLKGMSKIAFISVSIYVILVIKYYYLAVLLPVLIGYFFTDFLIEYIQKQKLSFSFQVIIFFFITFLVLIGSTFLNPNLYFSNFLQALVANHNKMLQYSPKSLAIQFSDLEPEVFSLLKNLPLALVSGLFRPFFWECRTVFQWVMGIENFFLLIWTIQAILNKKFNQISLLGLAGLTYILLLAMLLAFSSPNLGTLARYKVVFLPFLVYLLSFRK
ncbi:MAG: hypothetical protein H7Y04_02455 [Verrucomicrobia bacterium]|nr:hypothetical protein [Cytophagales bacterium]